MLNLLRWPAYVFSDFWWVVLCVGLGAWWWRRGELTNERAGRLFFVLIVTALLRQTEFLGNRFSPIFGFAGIGFIAFAWLGRGHDWELDECRQSRTAAHVANIPLLWLRLAHGHDRNLGHLEL